ncbi:16S rRNA (adenine1518-N6/adenine1519-N6)-dimethyltransferase [Litorivivens lipolytica]|uniref:Ribosomal RNA small subunit methyltransferase A n=1 Tax=Litorivivens lipolytica TaxID=1524264 RepID=A0A7W4W637_9GAMM|nr:16S rRNA (adenine(1518)-N(6)/adenine(1519)-N(6))-dimethyltransferase RsmA [Litorivivens lipolytica]MBB3048129.1 16S rRNA (adenine1518-N6/adenine1519-N6)-dimethyltransferase [Litorivivens lipolytica]
MTEHRARKRFGQNFLRDQGIIDRIGRAIRPQASDALVEIGPGQGALTEQLVASGAPLTLVELDRDLIPILEGQFSGHEHVTLLQADALKTDFASLYPEQKLRIVGNLPYNISTPLIFHLLAQHGRVKDMHFMLQKEVVDRLAAKPNTKAYGRLSVMTQYYCQVESLFEVPPEAFTPRPKVTSAVVRLTPFDPLPCPANNAEHLQALVRDAFNQRRKTLRNGLKTQASAEQIEAAGVDPGTRPETLELADFVRLSNALCPSG